MVGRYHANIKIYVIFRTEPIIELHRLGEGFWNLELSAGNNRWCCWWRLLSLMNDELFAGMLTGQHSDHTPHVRPTCPRAAAENAFATPHHVPHSPPPLPPHLYPVAATMRSSLHIYAIRITAHRTVPHPLHKEQIIIHLATPITFATIETILLSFKG